MSAADWIAKRRAALGLLSAYAALRGMAGDLTATVTVGSLGIRGADITAAEDDARTSLPAALDALEAVLAVIERDAGIVTHNDSVPISRISELVARPSPREYRRAIESALRGES